MPAMVTVVFGGVVMVISLVQAVVKIAVGGGEEKVCN